MPKAIPSHIRNLILRSLSPEDYERIATQLCSVTLALNDVVVFANTPIEAVYFIESGMASVVTVPPDGRGVEVASIGREGMTGVPIVLELDQTPLRTFIQVAGSGFRIDASALREAIDASPSLRRKFLHYSHTVTIQAAEAAQALGRFTIQQRLARWILLAQDRADSEHIYLTHDFLALMLGVRRSGVSDAMAILEGERLIKGLRGHIIVRDRALLIAKASGCYGRSEAEYARVFAA